MLSRLAKVERATEEVSQLIFYSIWWKYLCSLTDVCPSILLMASSVLSFIPLLLISFRLPIPSL